MIQNKRDKIIHSLIKQLAPIMIHFLKHLERIKIQFLLINLIQLLKLESLMQIS